MRGGNQIAKYQEWLTDDKLLLIEGWARDGLTNEQIAHNMGVSISTFKNWQRKHVAFLTAVKKGKEVIDYAVESALLQKALSGDVGAAVFWLKNRRPDKWRDKPEAAVKIDTSLMRALIEVCDGRCK